MSSGSWTVEYEAAVPADRLFKAAVLDWHNLGPKIVPQIIASAATLSGDGGVGSVRQLNFTPAMPFGFVKEKLDFLDLEKFESKQTLVEGGQLGSTLESASSHFTFSPTASGGCVAKMVANYKSLAGVDEAVEIVKAKEGLVGVFKAAEGFLLANPTAYA